jgi:hypothetical protein
MPVFTKVNGVIRESKEMYVNENNVIRKVRSGRVGRNLSQQGPPPDRIFKSYFDYEFDLFKNQSDIYMVFLLRPDPSVSIIGLFNKPGIDPSTNFTWNPFSSNPSISDINNFLWTNATATTNLNTQVLEIDVRAFFNYKSFQWELNMYILDNTANKNDLKNAKWWAVMDNLVGFSDEGVMERRSQYKMIYQLANTRFDKNHTREFKNTILEFEYSAAPLTSDTYGYASAFFPTINSLVPNTLAGNVKEYSLIPSYSRGSNRPKHGDVTQWETGIGAAAAFNAAGRCGAKYKFDFRNRIKYDGKPLSITPIVVAGYQASESPSHKTSFITSELAKDKGNIILNRDFLIKQLPV